VWWIDSGGTVHREEKEPAGVETGKSPLKKKKGKGSCNRLVKPQQKKQTKSPGKTQQKGGVFCHDDLGQGGDSMGERRRWMGGSIRSLALQLSGQMTKESFPVKGGGRGGSDYKLGAVSEEATYKKFERRGGH